MFKPDEADDAALKASKTSQAAERDELQRRLGAVLILRQGDGAVRSPVVTLSTEKTSVYNTVEKHLKAEAVVGTDRWWRLCRSLYTPTLEAWRPRVNGTQLKALQGVRLPESDAEWAVVGQTIHSLSGWLKEDSSPELFLAELKELTAYAQDWWENRTKREGKRGLGSSVLLSHKRQNLSGPQTLTVDLQNSHPLLQELAAAAVTGSATFPRTLAAPRNGTAGTESLSEFVEMITPEQAAHAGVSNGFAASAPANGPVSDPGSTQQISEHLQAHIGRLGPRFSAVTVFNGDVRQTDVVPLNVSGRVIVTDFANLTYVPGSHLSALATAWQAFPHQQIFLDRQPQAFEDLLDQLRSLRSGEVPIRLPKDSERLESLHREATYFALPAIAERVSEALQAAGDADAASTSDIKTPWQYDVLYTESGFMERPEHVLCAALAGIQATIDKRAAEGFEVCSTSTGSHARKTEDGSEHRNLYSSFLLRRPASDHTGTGE